MCAATLQSAVCAPTAVYLVATDAHVVLKHPNKPHRLVRLLRNMEEAPLCQKIVGGHPNGVQRPDSKRTRTTFTRYVSYGCTSVASCVSAQLPGSAAIANYQGALLALANPLSKSLTDPKILDAPAPDVHPNHQAVIAMPQGRLASSRWWPYRRAAPSGVPVGKGIHHLLPPTLQASSQKDRNTPHVQNLLMAQGFVLSQAAGETTLTLRIRRRRGTMKA